MDGPHPDPATPVGAGASDASSSGATSWRRPGPVAKDRIGLVLRLVLGGALFVAGALKVGDLNTSIQAVNAYQLLPVELARVIGVTLPFVEVASGAFLILGFATRVWAAVGGVLMIAFVIGISSVWARGLSIDCGCFSKGGALATDEVPALTYATEILRDLGLLVAAAWLVVRPRTAFSVDGALRRRRETLSDELAAAEQALLDAHADHGDGPGTSGSGNAPAAPPGHP